MQKRTTVYISPEASVYTLTHTKMRTILESKKVQVGKGQEKAQSEKIPTPKTEVGKNQTNNQVLIP